MFLCNPGYNVYLPVCYENYKSLLSIVNARAIILLYI